MITNLYDYLEGNNSNLAEADKTDRREFLKRMGLMGLAVVGLPSILSNLGGCASAPVRSEDLYIPIKSMVDIASKKELELEDFLLSKEEMYGLRLSQGYGERWGGDIRRPNPDLDADTHSCFGNRLKSHSCIQKIEAQYCTGTPPQRVMREHIVIGMNKYSSKKESEEVLKKLEIISKEAKEKAETRFFKNYEGQMVFRHPFLGLIGTRTNVPEAFLNDARERIENYKKIRKLSLSYMMTF